MLSDLGAIARAARAAPAQLDRMLELGEEIAAIGRAVLEITERLDERAEAILILGERLDVRAEAILILGERLDVRAEAILELGERLDGRTTDLIELGTRMHDLGDRVDARGAEVASQAGAVADTATELITVLPTIERALQLATPLEGAIDRFGRLVDRLPGGKRPDAGPAPSPAARLEAGAGPAPSPAAPPETGAGPSPPARPQADTRGPSMVDANDHPPPIRWRRPRDPSAPT
ncbi:MAG TPA: hypothetical protein VG388_05105 [Solirubrobacteraceae bacterium]|nr:hypothetical protein [Solirubrobacteraceae bacterium]